MNKGPIGGALLQAFFWCTDLRLAMINSTIHLAIQNDFVLSTKRAFYALDGEYDFIELPSDIDHDLFVTLLEKTRFEMAGWNLFGRILDVDVRLNVAFHPVPQLLVFSVREDMIWAYQSVDDAKCERLSAFFSLLEKLLGQARPSYAVIDTEGGEPSDVADLEEVRRRVPPFVHEEFFSDRNAKELYDWYLNIYVRRWDD